MTRMLCGGEPAPRAEPLIPTSKESIAVKPGVLVLMIVAALLAVLAVVGSGCTGNDHHVVIESNSCWIAVFDRQTASETNNCGNGNYRVAGNIHCVTVTNQADIGYVRVRIDSGPWSESALPRGTAEACR
jgi:hypothetical protein